MTIVADRVRARARTDIDDDGALGDDFPRRTLRVVRTCIAGSPRFDKFHEIYDRSYVYVYVGGSFVLCIFALWWIYACNQTTSDFCVQIKHARV